MCGMFVKLMSILTGCENERLLRINYLMGEDHFITEHVVHTHADP